MLRSLGWQTVDQLVRRQLQIYQELGGQIRMAEDDLRQVLGLNSREWADWSGLLRDGPLPANPELPVMLQRLGSATHRLALLAEHQDA